MLLFTHSKLTHSLIQNSLIQNSKLNMVGLLTILIALVCILLMGVVLIQNPKGGGLDSTFGGAAGANQLLGAARSTDFIEKLTWGLAAALFILCLLTSLYVRNSVGSGGGSGPGSISDEPTGYIDLQIESEDEDTYYL